MNPRICMCAAAAALLALGSQPSFAQSKNDSAPVSYLHEIRPLLKKRCGNCHNAEVHRGELDLSTYAATMEGSAGGPIATKGNLKDSLLYLTTHHLETPRMPPGKNKLPESELALIRAWIEGGLLEDRPAAGDPPASKPATPEPRKSTEPQKAPEVAVAAVTPPAVSKPAMEKVASKEGSKETPARAGAITALAAHPSQPLIAVAGQKQVILLDAERRSVERILPFPEGEAFVLRFSASGKLLLAAGGEHVESGRVVVWDLAGGNRVAEIGDESDVVLAADISPDETLVALGGPSKIVKVHRLSDGSLVHRLDKHTDWLLSIAFSPEGLLFATADRAGNLFLWETERGELVHTLRGHKGMITALSWRPDGDAILSGGEDGTIRLWSAHDGTETATWKGHAKGVTDLHYLADGTIVSSGRDRLCRTWTAEGQEKSALPEFASIPLRIAAVGPKGALTIGESAGTVSLQDLAAGSKLAVLNLPATVPTATEPTALATRNAPKAQEKPAAEGDFDRLLADAGRTQEELARLVRNGELLASRAESMQSTVEKARVAVKEAADEALQARTTLESAAKVLNELRREEERQAAEAAQAGDAKEIVSRLKVAETEHKVALARRDKGASLHHSLQETLKGLRDDSGTESLKDAVVLVRLAAERAAAAAESGRREVDESAALVEKLKKELNAATAKRGGDSPRQREALAAARQKYEQAVKALERSRNRLQDAEQSLGQLPVEGPLSPASK